MDRGDLRQLPRFHPAFGVELTPPSSNVLPVTVNTFKTELAQALKAFDRHIVCLEKSPPDARVSLQSLVEKAIEAYESRSAGLRHGIALDRHLTVILSQSDTDRPLCAIYFNLHTPYHKKPAAP
jgi:hypothetical protein